MMWYHKDNDRGNVGSMEAYYMYRTLFFPVAKLLASFQNVSVSYAHLR
jgi:hypothetical protein